MKFCVAFLAFLAFVCISSSVSAQRWFVLQHRPDGRVIGLLDLPDVTKDFADDACRSTELTAAPVYSQPSRDGAAIGAVYKRNHPEYGCGLLFKRSETSTEEELPTSESDYEIASAVVYERRARWFRIAVPQGSAWIEQANDEAFLPYPQLLSRRMAFLRNDWDGQLRRTAGFGFPSEPLPVEWKEHVPRQIGIEILGVTRVGNDDWIHVRLVNERCGDDTLKTLKPVQGWLPAYRPDGMTAAWFYSRGC